MFASSSSRILRSVCRQSSKFCTDAKPKYQKPHGRNVSLAIVLLGFVGGVYYTAINKMRVVRITPAFVLHRIHFAHQFSFRYPSLGRLHKDYRGGQSAAEAGEQAITVTL
jgi:hypothetical protein